jgi:DNA modification methylase
MLPINTIINADVLQGLRMLPDNSIDCCVTSPPYYALRDYGVNGQIGLEPTPELYIDKLAEVFEQVRRVLKPEGTLWLNIGDSYAGSNKGKGKKTDADDNNLQPQASTIGDTITTWNLPNYKNKDLIGIPFMLAFALRAKGWYLRQDIIWAKPNPMPESVTDRCTKSHEYIFLLTKSAHYYFDNQAIIEPAAFDNRSNFLRTPSKKYLQSSTGTFSVQTLNKGNSRRWREIDGHCIRNKRDVWFVPTKPMNEAHFATFPQKLIKDCILAGCPENGIVLDCFMGSGTTAITARKQNRKYIGIELNSDYIKIADKRLYNELGMFN